MIAGTSVFAALLAGLAALPHCLGMCGPLAAVACSTGRRRAREHAAYHAGRFATYAAVGALAGRASYALLSTPLGASATTLTSWLLALAFALSAFRVLSPYLHRGAADAPVALRRPPRGLVARLVSLVPRRGLPMGILTGLLPCGALASGALVAAASGGPLPGALAMLVFAAASAPALVLAIVAGSRIDRLLARVPRWTVGALLLLASAYCAVRPTWVRQDTCCSARAPSSMVVPR